MTAETKIQPVPDPRKAEALALLFSTHPPAEQAALVSITLQQIAAAYGLEGSHRLLESQQDGQTTGVILASVMPGRAALVWPPRLVWGIPETTAVALIEAAAAWLAAQGVRFAMAMPDPKDSSAATHLTLGGFDYAADVLYLAYDTASFNEETYAPKLKFHAWCGEDWSRMASLVESTYEATCDCPSLSGMRTIDDVLEGYRHTGVYSPARWLLAAREDKDVGCLLMADHPTQDNWELVYMGLVPAARGCGLGRQLVRHAQWLTHQAGRRQLVLGVDAANEPAVRIYARAGFCEFDRKTVFVKSIGS